MRIILVLIFALNFLQYPFLLHPFASAFISSFPGAVYIFETLFLHDIFTLIFTKFQSINQQIKSSEDIEAMENTSHRYCLLVDLANEIIKHFTMSLLFTFLFWFAYFIVSIYFSLCFITLRIVWLRTIFSILAFILYEIFWLFMMIHSFAQILNEERKIASQVHQIWNKYTTQGKIDAKIRHLELLAMRFFHTKLELTVNGFFTLDWTFCHLIISALATYCVIIIQFLI
ncbi:putative gustatory receptor 28a [Tribolium madens]|uniref:putative gustatory receptor 28a n=1 Tax=Tribolium madens TaxID=41895 RepID=UPI001CF74598|nr:putative gustatory receptor 28a [Tribolium madens]